MSSTVEVRTLTFSLTLTLVGGAVNKSQCADLKVLKAKDVQHSNEPGGIRAGVGAGVDLVDQPGECAGVESLRHCMAVLPCLENKPSQ